MSYARMSDLCSNRLGAASNNDKFLAPCNKLYSKTFTEMKVYPGFYEKAAAKAEAKTEAKVEPEDIKKIIDTGKQLVCKNC